MEKRLPYNAFFTLSGPYNGKGGQFLPLKKTEKVEYIRPGPSIRYKAIGGLLSVIRPGPYMRGNTVRTILCNIQCAPRQNLVYPMGKIF